jgi:hypothetical protein
LQQKVVDEEGTHLLLNMCAGKTNEGRGTYNESLYTFVNISCLSTRGLFELFLTRHCAAIITFGPVYSNLYAVSGLGVGGGAPQKV